MYVLKLLRWIVDLCLAEQIALYTDNAETLLLSSMS